MDGQPLRNHLEAYERHTGMVHERLANAPRLPTGCISLWRDFMALHNTRQYLSGAGPLPLNFSEMDAYQRMNSIRFEAWEIDAIRRADNAFLSEAAKQRKAGK